MVIYFTGTGNSQYVAEAAADRLDDEVLCINDYVRNKIHADLKSGKPWVCVFPVYLSSAAKIFADFLREADLDGEKEIYFIATCASAMGSTPNVCAEICKAKGLKYMGTAMIRMPQNYIALFTMMDEEECERRQAAALKSVSNICEVIKKGEPLIEKPAGKFEYGMTKMVEKMYYGGFTKTKQFYTTDECVGCGVCEKNCPLGNIKMVDGKPQWIDKCVHCMACINRCPKEAIEYGKGSLGKRRYVCKKYKKADE